MILMTTFLEKKNAHSLVTVTLSRVVVSASNHYFEESVKYVTYCVARSYSAYDGKGGGDHFV